MLRPFQQTITIPGTMAADYAFTFTAACDCTIKHISAVVSNAANTRIKVGTSADDDEFLTIAATGVSGTPVVWDEDTDFRYAVFPRIERGDVVIVSIDHDGAAGTAGANLSIVITYEEG